MTELSLRQTLASVDDDALTEGISKIMAWSARGSLRQWLMQRRTSWTPTSLLARGVVEAGFLYDPYQDIIYSRQDAWQREFGYCYAFDKFALMAGYVIDGEPIFFRHNNREWMLELWKGQYGIETGCEVGIYNRRDDDNGLDMQALDATIGRRENGAGQVDGQHSRFHKCVHSEDYLRIAFRLFRHGKLLFARGPEWHWWLTGFRWGVLSRPEDLVVEVSIGFLDSNMQQACIAGLQQAGYRNVRVEGSTVSFVFDTPHSYQPRMGWGGLQASVLAANGALVDTYAALGLPNHDPNQIEGALGEKVAGLCAGFLQNGRDFYTAQLDKVLQQVGTDAAQRVKDFFGIA